MHATVTTQTGGIMARLRDETAGQHRETEQQPLQRALATGRLPKEAYAAYLGQMLHVHRALEGELRSALERGAHGAIAAVYRPELDKAGFIETDLDVLDVAGARGEALAPTRELVERIGGLGAQSPVALLGALYVLEGSTNGGRFIARAVIRAYGLSDRRGYSYLDPYGDEQPMKWQRFKTEMDGTEIDEREAAMIVDAARAKFDGIGAISAAVWNG